jgi:glutamyl-tRNA reductase
MVGVNLQRVDADANRCLQDIKGIDVPALEQKIIDGLGFRVSQVSFVDKCNGFYIVVVYRGDFAISFIKNRILNAWDDATEDKLSYHLGRIQIYFDRDCLKYLYECALGLHSLVCGDNQVLSQIAGPLSEPYFSDGKADLLQKISRHILQTADEAKRKTTFYNGNVSIERVLCDDIAKSPANRVLLLGLGKRAD